MELLTKGAEGEVWLNREKGIIKKIRTEKKYRIRKLDEHLRKYRTRREFKVLEKAYNNKINVPKPIEINLNEKSIVIEYIDGIVLKDLFNEENALKLFNEIIKLHQLDIIHGDLTTLNAIVKDNKVYLIDFGLAEFNSNIEKKAEDLFLLFRNIENMHREFIYFIEKFEEMYAKKVDYKVIERLNEVRLRGRNKK